MVAAGRIRLAWLVRGSQPAAAEYPRAGRVMLIRAMIDTLRPCCQRVPLTLPSRGAGLARRRVRGGGW